MGERGGGEESERIGEGKLYTFLNRLQDFTIYLEGNPMDFTKCPSNLISSWTEHKSQNHSFSVKQN